MKLVVVTGCMGFIGSYVTVKCLERGWKVYGIDKLTYAHSEQICAGLFRHPNFKFIREDICDVKYLPDCDYIINVAAETHVGNSIINSDEFIKSNIEGVKNLLDLIRNKPSNVARRPIFFHFSTDEVYGDIEEGEHVETDPLKPSNPYSASKAAADMLVQAWARTYGVDWVLLRPTNNYGFNQYPEKLVPLSVKLLQRGKKIRLHDKGEPIRNWLHADDTAEAVMKIIDSGTVNEIYNVAGGFEQKNWETVKTIIEIYFELSEKKEVDWKEYVDLTYNREGQDVRYSLNDDKLRSLGWSAKKEFDKEIREIVKFYIEHFRW